jgi:two-component system, sensor histidine kinase YesM
LAGKLPRNLRNRYRDLSISKKIYIPNFAIIALLIVVSVFIANRVVQDVMIQGIEETTNQSLDIIIQSMDGISNNIEEAAAQVAADEQIQSVLLKLQDTTATEDIDHYFLVRSTLQKIVYLRSIVDAVTIYTADGVRVGTGNIGASEVVTRRVLGQSLIETAIANAGRSVWLNPQQAQDAYEKRTNLGVTMFRSIRSGEEGPIIGVLQMTLSDSIFSTLYSHLDYGRTGRFLVFDREGALIFPKEEPDDPIAGLIRSEWAAWRGASGQRQTMIPTEAGDFLVVTSRLDRLGWIVLGIVPIQDLLAYGRDATLWIYAIGAICIALEIAFAVHMARSISRPLSYVANSMNDAASGDLSVRLEYDAKDEIGRLSEAFNDMVERISTLMDKVYVQHRRERELELLALQSQINPHFLYNSLESICALSQLHRNEDAFRLGKALSLFYRGVLSNGRPVITIGEEVQTIRHYLIIQQMRYQEKLRYAIFVDEEILDQRIVKLSLQPLVENAIYHGLKAAHRSGRITIIGRRQEKGVRLTVVDNGFGCDSAQVIESMHREGETGNHGFGLASVDRRLKHCFGGDFGVGLESRPGQWTKVHLDIPYKEVDAQAI